MLQRSFYCRSQKKRNFSFWIFLFDFFTIHSVFINFIILLIHLVPESLVDFGIFCLGPYWPSSSASFPVSFCSKDRVSSTISLKSRRSNRFQPFRRLFPVFSAVWCGAADGSASQPWTATPAKRRGAGGARRIPSLCPHAPRDGCQSGPTSAEAAVRFSDTRLRTFERPCFSCFVRAVGGRSGVSLETV